MVDNVSILQLAVKSTILEFRANKASITPFNTVAPTPSFRTFCKSFTDRLVTFINLQVEQIMNIDKLVKEIMALHPVVYENFTQQRVVARKLARRGKPNFDIADYVLLAGEDFHAGEKPVIRWHGPRRVKKTVKNYDDVIEDLRTGALDKVQNCALSSTATASWTATQLWRMFLRQKPVRMSPVFSVLSNVQKTYMSFALAWTSCIGKYAWTDRLFLKERTNTILKTIAAQEYDIYHCWKTSTCTQSWTKSLKICKTVLLTNWIASSCHDGIGLIETLLFPLRRSIFRRIKVTVFCTWLPLPGCIDEVYTVCLVNDPLAGMLACLLNMTM